MRCNGTQIANERYPRRGKNIYIIFIEKINWTKKNIFKRIKSTKIAKDINLFYKIIKKEKGKE